MVPSANISNKSIHPQEGSKDKKVLLLPFRLHPHTNSAITWPPLVVSKNGLRHLVPHVILHLMKYRLSILFKMADLTSKAELNFSI